MLHVSASLNVSWSSLIEKPQEKKEKTQQGDLRVKTNKHS